MAYEREFKQLAARYKHLRLEQGMVQEDVLDHHFSVRHYQQLETGRPHSLTTFFRICAMFAMKPEILLKGVFNGNGRNGHKKKLPRHQ
jgi:transcriptional regulator with XRE-family HTH domain